MSSKYVVKSRRYSNQEWTEFASTIQLMMRHERTRPDFYAAIYGVLYEAAQQVYNDPYYGDGTPIEAEPIPEDAIDHLSDKLGDLAANELNDIANGDHRINFRDYLENDRD